MIISSRTPEGQPNHCSVCGSEVCINPSQPAGDAPCPKCGQLLWFPPNAITVVEGIGTTDFDTLLHLKHGHQPTKLLVNFQGVSFMSSSMITKLVMLNKAMKTRGAKLVFCNVSPNVLEVFKITKLDKLFNIQASEQEALSAFEKKGWFT